MMASSSPCLVAIFVAIWLQFLSISASTKSIDAICQHVTDKRFCIKTLTAYPPAASATNTFQTVSAAIHIAESYAEKCRKFTEKTAKENPKMKNQFMDCQDAYHRIVMSLRSAAGELKVSPDTSNYDVMVCTDQTTMVKDLVGKNRDVASNTIMKMTLMMNKLIAIAAAATDLLFPTEP
ncbi:hypothetical protein HID58_009329 [Brassica napus]|uniref:Pectinesterase inhibitor domain-containing protein n=1 Tax=Brassica napus TaxID=3708 RepID=A0ABQ8DT08_BRANA|nr:uncharacterized protein LOC111212826 [Brassica napus]KAH0932212.1 hypothetical protein HID58_009329 [Brassica napus]